MRFSPTKISDIKVGMLVEIKDLRTEKLIQGKILVIISQYDHPKGIIVKINSGNKGHINKIIETTIEDKLENQTEKSELLPESVNLEYKQSYKFHADNNTKKWVPSFAIFKTISGFANAEGGRIVVGVTDEKNEPLKITGLKNDFEFIGKIKTRNDYPYSADHDGMELRLISEFSHYFPKQELIKNLVAINFRGKKPEKMTCIIDVKRSSEAVIMYDDNAPEKKRGPHFFVRVGNQTIPYEPYYFCKYWTRHFLGMTGQEQIL